MNRSEAVTYIKEIYTLCKNMTPEAVSLIESEPNDQVATGYKVHIKALLDTESIQQITDIAQKHGLAVREEKDTVVIYKPREAIKAS